MILPNPKPCVSGFFMTSIADRKGYLTENFNNCYSILVNYNY